MNQRLRGIISSLRLDEPLKKLADIFGQHFGSNEKGTLMSDLHAIGGSPQSLQPPPEQKSKAPEKAERLDRHTSELLNAYEKRRSAGDHAIEPQQSASVQTLRPGIRVGIKHDRFGQGRINFSRFGHIRRDSYVAVGQNIPENWYAGRIQEIFSYTHRGLTAEVAGYTETYFVVERFKELSKTDASHDPYRKQLFVGGRLFYDAFEDDLELIPRGGILCHVAYTPVSLTSIKSRCIHALPLNRVCSQ
jgi:hypothetical protein